MSCKWRADCTEKNAQSLIWRVVRIHRLIHSLDKTVRGSLDRFGGIWVDVPENH